MTVDYAKRRTPLRPDDSSNKAIVIAGCIGVSILLIAGVMRHHYHAQQRSSGHTAPKTTAQPQEAQNQFDFYSMLQKMKVPVKIASPDENTQIPAGQPFFLIQVATTTSLDGAQKMTTKLGVMGLNANTKPFASPNGVKTYRVLVGPYPNHKDAVTDQVFLRTNHMDSLLIAEK